MKYLEWNNIIALFFFNSENAGKEIHLYLTKNDIISIGRPFFMEESEDEIWLDYISSIKRGLPGSTGNIMAKAKFAHSKNNLVGLIKSDGSNTMIDDVPVLFPPYISYLSFIILPLIEDVDNKDLRVNNYYGRLNSFLKKHQIYETIGTADLSNNQINCLWEDLAHWANVRNNGYLGLFKLIPFQNANWVYVGKVFSQCVLPPKFLNRLPELFETLGLVPNTFYDRKYLKEIILKCKSEIIPISTFDYLKNDDELSSSIIQKIQDQYLKWSGETRREIEDGKNKSKRRHDTLATLFVQFRLNKADEVISFSYRMFSKNDYPEDLKFRDFENLYELNGWSKTIPVEFMEGLELEDSFNKWIAKSPDRDVRLFKSAGTLHLSNDFWIETDRLSRLESMYLLCTNNKQDLINEWGNTFQNGDFKQEDYEGLPENYSLFFFRNPMQSLSECPILTLYNEKHIEFVGGLKVNFRTFSREFLPGIEIVNSNGSEKVYLQYKGTQIKIFLEKDNFLTNRWLIPKSTEVNVDFFIKVDGETFSGNTLSYKLISSFNTAIKVDGLNLPKRDSYGRNIENEVKQYCLGSNVVNPNKSSQRLFSPYDHLFISTFQDIQIDLTNAKINNHNGYNLCDFLSMKSELTAKEYFSAFEFFYSKEFFEHKTNKKFNLAKLKRASLNFYDYIGILDYDYETKNIILNPPQLIFIPTDRGRTVLLIGARDTSLLEKIISTAPKYNLQVKITKQCPSNERLLLPDVVSIKAFRQNNDLFGENSIKAFANELNIRFEPNYYPQVALQDFSATISDYENTLKEIDESDHDWARYIFNIETLEFDKSVTQCFEKSFSLVKYKLNEYTYQFKLWRENKCYRVDMNWGRFLVLWHFKKNVILFDGIKNQVAIPIELPLPRLLAESIMTLSGFAPDFKIIEEKQYRIYSNIPSIFTSNLFRKLGQNPIKKDL
jgi:hypothetical protein